MDEELKECIRESIIKVLKRNSVPYADAKEILEKALSDLSTLAKIQ